MSNSISPQIGSQMNPPWQAGDRLLEQYRVTAILGEDALGELYKVHHLSWKTDLLVRCLSRGVAASLGGVESLQAAVDRWINLGVHPHILTAYTLRCPDTLPLLITEYLPSTLGDWIRDRRLYTGTALRRILDVAIQTAWGLHYAQDRGISPVWVTPETIRLTPESVAKLSDVGLAAPTTARELPTLLSPQADLWSWGTVVLAMFVGEAVAPANATQRLDCYLNSAGDAALPPMPDRVVQLLRRCFQVGSGSGESASLSFLAIARELQGCYQASTGCPYFRREPGPTQDADLLNNKALCLWDAGQVEEAMALWEQALAIQPQHPEAIYNQNLLRWRAGDIDDGMVLRQLEYCRTVSQAEKVEYLISQVQLERGDSETALQLLSQPPADPASAGIDLEEWNAALAVATQHPSRKRLMWRLEQTTPEASATPPVIALSADGRYGLSGGTDRQIRLWEVETGRCLYTFKGHQGAVTAVTFSDDGCYVASGSEDQTLRLWNVTATHLVHTFDGLRERRSGYQNAVDQWLERLKVTAKLVLGRHGAGHQGTVRSVALSPDRQYLLSGGDDRAIKLWDMESGRCVQTFHGHRQRVFSVQFCPDRRHILSASDDQTVRLWDIVTGRVVRTLQGFHDLSAIALSTDGRQVLTAGSLMRLWDLDSGEAVKTLAAPTARVTAVAWSACGDYVLSGGEDQQLKLWQVATGRCLRSFPGHSAAVATLCLSADGRYAFSTDAQALHVWAVECSTPTPLAPLRPARRYSVETISPSDRSYVQALIAAQQSIEQGYFVAAAQQLRQARLQPGYNQSAEAVQAWLRLYLHLPRHTLNAVWEQASFRRHTGAVQAVAFSPDACLALSAGVDQSLKLWDITREQCLLSLEGHRGPIHSVAFDRDGSLALSAGSDGQVKVWQIPSGDERWTLTGHRGPIFAIACSPDGRLALSGSADRTLKLWDLTSGDCLRTLEGHSAAVRSVGLSADQKLIVSGGDDQTLKLWNLNGDCLRTLNAHAAAVQTVLITPDSRFIISGSADQSVKLWSLNGDCLWTLNTSAPVRSLAFSSDSRYLLSAGDDPALTLWLLDWDLVDTLPAAWDEGARPYLDAFLTLHQPRTSTPDASGAAVGSSVANWTDSDLQRLLRTLQQAGYGWLQPEGVRQQLLRMAQAATVKPALPTTDSTVFATAFVTEFTTAFGGPGTRVILSFTSGSLKGQEFIFRERTTCILGRAKDCQIQLPNDEQHNTVSRYHCALEIEPPAVRIRDLGSLHGTYLNGQLIGKRSPNPNGQAATEFPTHELTSGDEIRLGKAAMRLSIEIRPAEATWVDETALNH